MIFDYFLLNCILAKRYVGSVCFFAGRMRLYARGDRDMGMDGSDNDREKSGQSAYGT